MRKLFSLLLALILAGCTSRGDVFPTALTLPTGTPVAPFVTPTVSGTMESEDQNKQQLFEFSGTLCLDENGDGECQDGEGVAGAKVTVQLLWANLDLKSVTQTDENGHWQTSILANADYYTEKFDFNISLPTVGACQANIKYDYQGTKIRYDIALEKICKVQV